MKTPREELLEIALIDAWRALRRFDQEIRVDYVIPMTWRTLKEAYRSAANAGVVFDGKEVALR